MHVGIDRWEEMVQVGNINEYDGVCREYKNPPQDQLWIIAQYTSPAAVILGAFASLMLWKATLCPVTKTGWRVLLLFVLLCPFTEITTIIFFLYGNGCLNSSDKIRARCYPSQGEVSAGVAVFIWFLVCFIMWKYPPQHMSSEKDKVDKFESDIGTISKGGLIELQELPIKSEREAKQSKEETEFALSVTETTVADLSIPTFASLRSSFRSSGSLERFFQKADKDAMNLGHSDSRSLENSNKSLSLKSENEGEDLTSVTLNASVHGLNIREMV